MEENAWNAWMVARNARMEKSAVYARVGGCGIRTDSVLIPWLDIAQRVKLRMRVFARAAIQGFT